MKDVASKHKDHSFVQAVEKTLKAFRYFTQSYTVSTLGAQEYHVAEADEDAEPIQAREDDSPRD
jgi:hypothetical protein